MVWGYFRSGADSELTLAANPAAWQSLRLMPRMLVDVSSRDLSTTVLGQDLAFPVLVAPTAFQRMAHPDGELATARAVASTGTIMVLSTISNTPVEQVAATGANTWFQLYVHRDREISRALVRRVEDAGCRALVVTVDTPLLGRREADVRTGFRMPGHLRLPNMEEQGRALQADSTSQGSALAQYAADSLDPSMTWADIERFAADTPLPVVVKGVLRVDDARRAVDHGARAVVVSNHGGRQLDTVPATAEVIEGIVDAVGDRCEVLVDGGLRRGTDVLKALALGARAVLVGRPVLWGLAVNGKAGVQDVLQILREELDRAMALSGCPDLGHCTRDLVWPRDS
jgi:4-hydroxymandelate oxidase